ncbi:hypothetical protein L596_000269 [Steinernema carpocapsae]|uniref:Uncharacterized protein n=1 Tax=Steinernema carpocapsae TaxID=34508 RepID=A0A4U8UK30_STECR|nr:hypothetical protein L596_000269 [Steinernema carpocapsae]
MVSKSVRCAIVELYRAGRSKPEICKALNLRRMPSNACSTDFVQVATSRTVPKAEDRSLQKPHREAVRKKIKRNPFLSRTFR